MNDLQRLKRINRSYPSQLVQIPKEKWPHAQANLIEVWRSRDFLVQVLEQEPLWRMSVCRTMLNRRQRFVDGIAWEDLQRLKAEIGKGDYCAVEIYPRDRDLVNVANMRHLWLLPEVPGYCWSDDNHGN